MLDELPNISRLPFDIRAEVLARLMADHFGLTTEQVLYRPDYWHQRPGRKDVIGLSEEFSHRLEKDLLSIETSREGWFDTLPQSVFIHPEEEVGSSFSRQEEKARQFLLPFEQLFFWLRLENEQHEYAFENRLKDWWNQLIPARDAKTLEGRQRAIFLEMIPYLHEIIGNWTLTEQWLEILTGQKVKITEEALPVYQLPDELQKRVGAATLGKDLVLGKQFIDGIPAIAIRFEAVTPEILINLLPGGSMREMLEEDLLPFLLPVETPFSVEMDGAQTAIDLKLVKDNEANVLGYTMHL